MNGKIRRIAIKSIRSWWGNHIRSSTIKDSTTFAQGEADHNTTVLLLAMLGIIIVDFLETI